MHSEVVDRARVAAGRVVDQRVNHSRMLILRIPETWPWAQQFADAFNRVLAIP